MKWIFGFIAIISIGAPALGQESKQTLIEGNASFREGDFSAAEEAYRKAGDDKSLEDIAQFNLGDALYRQGKFDEAAELFGKLAQGSENQSIRSRSYHNLGNSMLSKQDYAKAMQAYKEALKLDPSDKDARYNLAYARKMLQQQQQQQQQNQDGQGEQEKQDEQNGDKDQQQDGQQNQDEQGNPDKQDQQDQNKGNQDQQQDGNGQQNEQGKDGKNGQDQQQDGNNQPQEQAMPEPGQLSPEDAARILEAIDKAEQDLQGKLRKHKGTGPAKKIEKDW